MEDDREHRLVYAPWPVKVYVGLYVAVSALWTIGRSIETSGRPTWAYVTGGVVGFLLFVLPIVRGSRLGWGVILVVTAGSLLFVGNETRMIWRAVQGATTIVNVALLLHPATQRWCRVRLW